MSHRDLQAPRRAVDGLERAPDLGDVGGTRAQEELPSAAAQGAARLDERLESGQDLLDRPVAQRNDFKSVLRGGNQRHQTAQDNEHYTDQV